MDRSIIDFWDKFEFVGNSYDDRVIWAVGQVKPDSMCLGNGVIVTELHHKGELTPENLPNDAPFYFQYHLNSRKGMILRRFKKLIQK